MFALILAYHIWHMGLSPQEDVSSAFMILIRRWPLIWRSILFGLLHWFVFRSQLFCPTKLPYIVWHVSVPQWFDVSRTSMNSVWPLPLTSISKFTMEFSLVRCFIVWHRHTKCCVHSWLKYDLDHCHKCGWWGYP